MPSRRQCVAEIIRRPNGIAWRVLDARIVARQFATAAARKLPINNKYQ
jgi:hypothetical protein